MSKFKVGDRVKIIESYESFFSKNHAIKGSKKIVKEIGGDSFKDMLYFTDDTKANIRRCKLLKPKLTEKRIREIIREELNINKQTEDKVDAISLCDKITGQSNMVGFLHSLNEPKEESKNKSGWCKNDKYDKWLVYYDFNKVIIYGFDINGEWFEDTLMIDRGIDGGDVAADPKEVEQRLIEEAERRGFKKGIEVSREGFQINDLDQVISNVCSKGIHTYMGSVFIGDIEVYDGSAGKWATIIKGTVTINGFDMKQDGDIISFGCAEFNKKYLSSMYEWIKASSLTWGRNGKGNPNGGQEIDKYNKKGVRYIKSITLDSDVTITIEELERIVKAIK